MRPKLQFSRFLSIFWFGHGIFGCNLFTYDVIQHANTKKPMYVSIGSKKIRKNGNGNLMKTVANHLEKKNAIFFLNKAHPKILSDMS